MGFESPQDALLIKKPVVIRLISCGKAEIEKSIHASLYLDCRVMVNPFRDPVLGGLTGDSPEVQAWIKKSNAPLVTLFIGVIHQGLLTRSSRNSGRGDAPFTVCTFCLAGVHRSRGMKHVLAERLRDLAYTVEVA